MKTKDFARVLIALADIAEFERSHELHRLARFFDQGANETMLARLKRLHPSHGHPANLKQSLVSVHAAFKSAGAKKQAQLVGLVLGLFGGRGGATVETFIAEISSPADHQNLPAGPLVDADIANTIIDRLNSARLDEDSFNKILTALRSPSDVSVPTLAYIARRFLGDKVSYRDRRTAVRVIARHYRTITAGAASTREGDAQIATAAALR